MDILFRANVSEDGTSIAFVSNDQYVHLLQVTYLYSFQPLGSSSLAKSYSTLLQRLTVLKWSHRQSLDDGSDEDGSTPWLLLSDGARLLTLAPSADTTAHVVADYQLGDQYGRLTHADFIVGRHHALLMFEMGPHASILSLIHPQRDDIPNIKFADSRSLARSIDHQSVAMLLRVKGQDQISILTLKGVAISPGASLALQTADAQGLQWSPNGDPVLAIWDAAAYGVRVLFVSAMGHPLKQLDLTSIDPATAVPGIGVSNLRWAGKERQTVLAVADGHKQVMLRQQTSRTMAVKPINHLKHPQIIDGSKSIVWQQTGPDFSLQKGAFDAILDSSAGGDTIHLEFNANYSLLATVVADNPKTLWLWQPEHPDPHTVVTFQDNIRQVLWHPQNANVLAVVTVQKSPAVYFWFSETKAPQACNIPLSNTASTRFEGAWLSHGNGSRCPFFLSSTKSFNVGLVEQVDGVIRFQSLPWETARRDDEESTEEIQTPSKRGKEAVKPRMQEARLDFDEPDARRW